MVKMQITKIVTALLFVSFTSAHTDFIPDGNRAELFEIMDHEVPDFRITVPAADFEEMKRQINQSNGFFKRQWDWGQGGWNPGQGQGQGGWNPGQGQGQGQGNGQGNGMNWGNGGINWGNGGMNWGNGGGGGFGIGQKENFKIKDCQMVVNINGEQKTFDKINFGIGGSSSRSYSRQAFNLKIKGKQNLFGRKQFRIRSDAREATYLRSKLACDLHNRLGLPSIAANYISLYVNDEYWGFYVLMDAPKPSWAEIEYGDKDTTHLFKCKAGAVTLSANGGNCENENEDFQDTTEWRSFLSSLDNARSDKDADRIFDVDQFLYEMAYEYLSGTWDHYLNTGHNFAVYKMPENHGGKWTMIHYDFDADFGQDVCAVQFAGATNPNKDYPSWSFDEWATKKAHLLDICIRNNRSRFNAIMKRFVEEAFNPDLLFPRIDELKDFIRPYVKKDKTPDRNGKKPGMLNTKVNNDYTMEQWEANSEFTNIGPSEYSSGYGLKFWILLRYRKVCKDFNLNCNKEYLDLNYYYDIDRNVEGPINTEFRMPGMPGFGFQPINNGGGRTTTRQSQPPKPTSTRTTTRRTTTTTTRKSGSTPVAGCIAASQGYPCCSNSNTEVVYQDESGDWGIENGEWCGITKVPGSVPAECWAKKLDYPCCSQCIDVVYTDDDGKWGIENDDWCGLPSNC